MSWQAGFWRIGRSLQRQANSNSAANRHTKAGWGKHRDLLAMVRNYNVFSELRESAWAGFARNADCLPRWRRVFLFNQPEEQRHAQEARRLYPDRVADRNRDHRHFGRYRNSEVRQD